MFVRLLVFVDWVREEVSESVLRLRRCPPVPAGSLSPASLPLSLCLAVSRLLRCKDDG